MSTSHRLLPPAKRRKTKRTNQLREDDVNAMDAVTVERITVDTKAGPVQRKIIVPLPEPKHTENIESYTTGEVDHGYSLNNNDGMPGEFAAPQVPLESEAPQKKKEVRSNIYLFRKLTT
jgi:hypothetical protein